MRLCVAQRLVRRICPHCRQPEQITKDQARALGRSDAEEITAFSASGCIRCAGRMYSGRLGLFEMIPIDEEFSRAISASASEPEIIEMTRQRKLGRLVDDAIAKLASGQTSVHEALAAVTVW